MFPKFGLGNLHLMDYLGKSLKFRKVQHVTLHGHGCNILLESQASNATFLFTILSQYILKYLCRLLSHDHCNISCVFK